MMRLLDKFLDAQGRPMSQAWMTPADRKVARAKERDDAETLVFGDADAVMALKAVLDFRAHPVIHRFVKLRVNPMIASLEMVGTVNRAMSVVLTALRDRAHTMRELTDIVATRCGYSAQNARREAFATVSILTACDRATRTDATVELT